MSETKKRFWGTVYEVKLKGREWAIVLAVLVGLIVTIAILVT